jgi:ubiquinone/menaquinone biosynthesis C-methylase UbiE
VLEPGRKWPRYVDLKFEDQSFDLIYTNVYDHALYPDKFCAEMLRVVRPGGFILINFQVAQKGDKYSVTHVSNPSEEVLPLLPGCEVRLNMPISENVHAMDWERLVQKLA